MYSIALTESRAVSCKINETPRNNLSKSVTREGILSIGSTVFRKI